MRTFTFQAIPPKKNQAAWLRLPISIVFALVLGAVFAQGSWAAVSDPQSGRMMEAPLAAAAVDLSRGAPVLGCVAHRIASDANAGGGSKVADQLDGEALTAARMQPTMPHSPAHGSIQRAGMLTWPDALLRPPA